MNTQEMISIKAKHQNEIRRFALPQKSSFATLETTLNSLFSLSNPVIKYTDDEGDLCTISTQQELDYAVSTNQGLLRLHLFAPEDLQAPAPVISAPQIPLCSAIPSTCSAFPNPDRKHFLLEKMDNKHSQLVSKRDDLSAKLASDEINSERRRVLSWKLEKIQDKIAGLEARRQQMAHHLANPDSEHPWRGRGGGRGGRGGRGGPHGHHGHPGHHEHPGQHPHHEHGMMPEGQQPTEQPCQPKEQRWMDWMDKRQGNLTSKRDSLNLKLADESITPQRKAALEAKSQKVQEKLTALEARRQQLATEGPSCGGRGGRRGGRGGWRHMDIPSANATGHCGQQTDDATPK